MHSTRPGRETPDPAPTPEEIEAALRVLRAAAEGHVRPPAVALTVVKAIEIYLEARASKCRPAGMASQRARLKRICAWLGPDRLANSLSPADVDEFVGAVVEEGRSEGYAGQCVRALNTALELCVRRRLIVENPIRGFELAAAKVRRDRVFTPCEIAAMLDAARRMGLVEIFAMISILKDSGVRPGELRKLRATDVDFGAGVIRVPSKVAKTGRARSVALLPDGAVALRTLSRRSRTGFLFESDRVDAPISYSVLWAQWVRVIEFVPIRPNTDGSRPLLYSLRHTLATKLGMDLGWSPHQIATWMGWENAGQAATYVRAQDEHLRAGAAALLAAGKAPPPLANGRGRSHAA